MKLFMTGVCGRLGRAVCQAAGQQGVQVVGLDVAPWPQAITPQPAHVQVHQGSFDDPALVERLLTGCDAIVHAGGYHGEHVGKVETARFIQAHVAQMAGVLEAGHRAGVRHVVLCSTMEVLVGRDWRASGAAWLDEDSPPVPDSAYSLSRHLMEVMGRHIARWTGMSVVSLRYMAFGYEDNSQLGLELLAHSVGVADVARAVLLAAAKPGLRGEVIHIGPATPLTPADIGQALADPSAVLEKHYPGASAVLGEHAAQLQARMFWPVTSIRRAELLLGWRPTYTLRDWLIERGWQPPAA